MSNIGRAVTWLAVFAGTGSWAHGADRRVTVRNPGGALGETPVLTLLKTPIAPGDYRLQPDQGPAAPAQVFADGGTTYLATVLKEFPARSTLAFTLVPEAKSETAPVVALKPEGKDVEVTVAGKPLTVYRAGEASKPYFYPVFGPTGAPFTRAYPMKTDVAGEKHDHPHQRSFWFTHGKVNGVDFWASDPINGDKPAFGTIKETSRTTVSGPAVGLIHTTDDWLDHEGKLVLKDERVVLFYNTADTRVIDFDVILKAVDKPVTFGDTKEGSFGLRVATSMDVDNKKQPGGKITNAEGVTDAAAWGKASPWVDYTGPVDGKTVGVAILNHPSSFRYPTTWHVRTYGLFAANPFGWNDFGLKKSGDHVIQPDAPIRLSYRVVLHEGDTTSARVADAFRAYAHPPVVEITPD